MRDTSRPSASYNAAKSGALLFQTALPKPESAPFPCWPPIGYEVVVVGLGEFDAVVSITRRVGQIGVITGTHSSCIAAFCNAR